MGTVVRVIIALGCASTPSVGCAEDQYKLLAIAMPSKYHDEHIPVAQDSIEHMARLHAFSVSWTSDSAVFNGDRRVTYAGRRLDVHP